MEYIKAAKENADDIFHIVQKTVKTVYPRYYPREVVDFFCGLHNKEKIAEDIEKGNVGILTVNHQIAGTGSREGNHITRVYVLPEFQGKGYGSFIMRRLEDEIAKKHDATLVDASLPAVCFYGQRGYQTLKHERLTVENGAVLVYDVMEKHFQVKTENMGG